MSGTTSAAAMTWDPAHNAGMALSNGNLTSTWGGGVAGYVLGTVPIAESTKEYFEVQTSGFYAGTAFAIGVAGLNFTAATGDGYGGPGGIVAPDVTVHWDGIVDVDSNWVSNPHRASASMDDGGYLAIAVDRVNQKFWWKSSLTNQWNENGGADPATNSGGIDISALKNVGSLYASMSDGSSAGPVGTVNGGARPLHFSVPTGFTAIDAVGSGGSGSSGGGNSGGGSNGGSSNSGSGSSSVTIGSGPNTLALQVSEDAWNGDAQFTVSVDGRQIEGTQTATASHAAGQAQTFNVLGTFAAGSHTVAVNFLNDAYGGSSASDRNLYVTGATIDGTSIPGAGLAEYSGGPQAFTFQGAGTSNSGSSGSNSGSGNSGNGAGSSSVTIGSGSNTLALQVSEDAWNGDARFTVSIDGRQIDGTQTATASHAAGQAQTFNVLGTFAPGRHTVAVNFLNDAYAGTSATDRNLYVTGASIDGTAVSGATLSEYSQGPQSFSFLMSGNTGF